METTNDDDANKWRRTEGPDAASERVSPQSAEMSAERMIKMLRDSLDPTEAKGLCQELNLVGWNPIAFITRGGIDAVISCMMNHSTEVEILVACMDLLLQTNDHNIDDLTNNIVDVGIGCIITAMNNNTNSQRVQRAGCNLIVELLCDHVQTSSESLDKFITKGGIECLLSAMDRHTTDVEVVNHACKALCSLHLRRDSLRIFLSNGGTRCVLSAMNAHKEDKEIIWNFFLLLETLINESVDVKLQVIQTDGLGKIVEGIELHQFQVKGYAILASLFDKPLYPTLPSRHDKPLYPAQEALGLTVDALLGALKEHEADEYIHSNVTAVLSGLARTYSEFIASKGGLKATVAAMRRFPESCECATNCINTMASMLNNYSIRSSFLNNKAMTIVAEIMQYLPAVGAVMQNLPRDMDVQEKCCELLYKLLDNGKAKAAISSDDALLGGLLTTMRNHEDISSSWRLGNARIKRSIDVFKRFVEKQDANDGLLTTMPDHEDVPNARIPQLCCEIFCHLAKVKNTKDKLKKMGAVAAVSSALEKHPNHNEIQAHRALALKLLESENEKVESENEESESENEESESGIEDE